MPAWVTKLGSDRADEREAATKALKAVGLRAIPELERTAQGGDPEVVQRSLHLIRVIRLVDVLGPRLLRALPGIEERLSGDDPAAWTAALLAAGQKTEGLPEHPQLTRNDLNLLAARALEGAQDPREKAALCDIVRTRFLTGAARGLVAWLLDENLAAMAASALGSIRHRDAVVPLTAMLEHDRPDCLQAAAEALVEMNASKSTPRLLELLGHPRPETRMGALRVLATFDDPGIVSKVAPLLLDVSPGVRYHAITALGRRRAPAKLMRAALGDPQPSVQRACVEALAGISAREEWPTIARLLESEDKDVRRAVLRFAAELRPDGAEACLRKGLKDSAPELRREAAWGLAVFDPGESRRFAHALLKSEEVDARQFAARLLGQVGDREDASALLPLLENGGRELRMQALSALAELAPDGMAEKVVRMLVHDPEEAVRELAAELLPSLATSRDADLLVGLTTSTNDLVWGAAASTLASWGYEPIVPKVLDRFRREGPSGPALEPLVRLGVEEAVPALRLSLRDRRPELRAVSLRALARLGPSPSPEDLDSFWQDNSPEVRRVAAEMAGRWKVAGAAAALRRLARDDVDSVREAALIALGRLRDPESAAEALALVEDPNPRIRLAAIEALGEARSNAAVPGLIRALGRPDWGVSVAAAEALARIGQAPAEKALVDLAWRGSYIERLIALRGLAELSAPSAKSIALHALRDPDRSTRCAAASLLCAIGVREGAALLIRERRDLWWLNALRAPEVWKRWRSPREPIPLLGTRRDLAVRLAEGTPNSRIEGAEALAGGRMLLLPGARGRLDELLQLLRPSFDVRLETDCVVVLTLAEAAGYWQKWLEDAK